MMMEALREAGIETHKPVGVVKGMMLPEKMIPCLVEIGFVWDAVPAWLMDRYNPETPLHPDYGVILSVQCGEIEKCVKVDIRGDIQYRAARPSTDGRVLKVDNGLIRLAFFQGKEFLRAVQSYRDGR